MYEALAVLLAYFWGAIPSSYLVARYRRGIDIRRYGSGNVGASNLMRHVGVRVGLLIGTFDGLVKGTLPVLAARVAGLDLGWQVGVGLAAVAGHNWSPYIRFTGGRGLATALGVLLAFALWWQLLTIAFVAGLVGFFILHRFALLQLISWAVAPLVTYLVRQVYPPLEWSMGMVYLTLGILGLLVAKRLTANWEHPAEGVSLGRVLLYRLLVDRDISDSGAWVRRTPPEGRSR